MNQYAMEGNKALGASTGIEVHRLSPALGAELHGIDLGAGVDDATFAVIHAALMEHQVIFFRDQDMSVDRHLELSRRFGSPTYSKKLPKYDNYDHVSLIESDGSKVNVGGRWHTDNTDFAAPPMGAVLYAEETPQIGGDTLFANMYAAYEGLSDGMKKTLEGLRAVHSNEMAFGAAGFYKNTDQGAGFKGEDLVGSAVHPVVLAHPETGRKALYVNPGFTMHFEGWTAEESEGLLAYLYRHATRPEYTCRFEWRPGSIAFWDNRCTWHYAVNDYHGQKRLMHRITIGGSALN